MDVQQARDEMTELAKRGNRLAQLHAEVTSLAESPVGRQTEAMRSLLGMFLKLLEIEVFGEPFTARPASHHP